MHAKNSLGVLADEIYEACSNILFKQKSEKEAKLRMIKTLKCESMNFCNLK